MELLFIFTEANPQRKTFCFLKIKNDNSAIFGIRTLRCVSSVFKYLL